MEDIQASGGASTDELTPRETDNVTETPPEVSPANASATETPDAQTAVLPEETVENSENPVAAEDVQPPVEVIGIRFKKSGKIYYFDPDGGTFDSGMNAIVETARGIEYGSVALGNRMVPAAEIVPPLRRVIRVSTPEDDKKHEENSAREKEAFEVCVRKINEHKLDMKLIDVEYTFDNNKLLFYFTADGRIDFRDLVKDLASVFRTRIELRQIGIRDEAKMLGGLGICGRPFCCASFLGDFVQVSIKMAKDQNLSLNSAKISGSCGRLMCCLRYEYDTYEEELRKTPRIDSIVTTPNGDGTVVEVRPLSGQIRVRLFNDPDQPPKVFSCSEVYPKGAARPESASADAEKSNAQSEENVRQSGSRQERQGQDRRPRYDRKRPPAKPMEKKPELAKSASGDAGDGRRPQQKQNQVRRDQPPRPNTGRPSPDRPKPQPQDNAPKNSAAVKPQNERPRGSDIPKPQGERGNQRPQNQRRPKNRPKTQNQQNQELKSASEARTEDIVSTSEGEKRNNPRFNRRENRPPKPKTANGDNNGGEKVNN